MSPVPIREKTSSAWVSACWSSSAPSSEISRRSRASGTPRSAESCRRVSCVEADNWRNGIDVAAGAGANIALACDVVVAHEKVDFIQAFSAIGLVPDSGGTFFLPRLVGFQKALALAMLADKVNAVEAERIGMIYKVLPSETFENDAYAIAKRLANMPTKGLALTKRLFNQSLTNDLETQLDLEGKLQIEASQTEDYQEGVSAFLEKRKPIFKGK